MSGGITLLVKLKHEKYVSIEKKSKNYIWCEVSKDLFNNNRDLFLCGAYIPPEKSKYFDQEMFEKLENDIIKFLAKGNAILLGDFNGRTSTLEDFVSKDGNNYINDLSNDSLQPKNRLNFDNTTNNHGLQLINICKNTDIRILNGRTKGDSLGRPTFHGNNGTSIIDYAICNQETFQSVNNFVVKPPTYLSDHSQIIAWVDINKNLPERETNLPKPEWTPLHKLPLQFDWSENSKINFRQTLKSPEIQRKLDNFIQSTFIDDEKGVNDCATEFQNVLTDAAKKSLKIRKKKTRRKISNPMNKKKNGLTRNVDLRDMNSVNLQTKNIEIQQT